MSPITVALIYDNTVRPDTTGEYCKRALQRLCHVTHFLPSQLSDGGLQIADCGLNDSNPKSEIQNPQSYDLYLHIDDGLGYSLPEGLRPSAWWVIDTHLQYQQDLEKARRFDFVFAAQKDGAERLRQDGIRNVTWLPLACDPDIHAPHPVPKVYDVCFVGNTFTGTPLAGKREELLQVLVREFPNHFIGRRFFLDMARTYSESRVVFNCSVRNDLNMRVFEALACGSLLVTNDLSDGTVGSENGQDELFTPGKHLVTYRDESDSNSASSPRTLRVRRVRNDLVNKVRYYLDHHEEREAIATTGRREALANHTYSHRMETILRKVGLWKTQDESRIGRVGEREQDKPAHRDGGMDPTNSEQPRIEGEAFDAIREDAPIRDLVSMVILCWNEVETTRKCIESLVTHTTWPYELVFVDNGSTDDTQTYLLDLKATATADHYPACHGLKVITNSTNHGFARGCNQGIHASRGEFLLLLNNDVVVTDGWLNRMVALARSEATIGMVGPRSNYVSGPQGVMTGYLDAIEMRRFAASWSDAHAGQWSEMERLVGFCLLIKRETLQRIGELDERFSVGMFEDDDLCLRARFAGYRLACAHDVFVHHFGSQTFRGSKVDAARVHEENLARFREKWGDQTPVAYRATPTAVEPIRRAEPSSSGTDVVAEETEEERLEKARRWLRQGKLIEAGQAFLACIEGSPGKEEIKASLVLVRSRLLQRPTHTKPPRGKKRKGQRFDSEAAEALLSRIDEVLVQRREEAPRSAKPKVSLCMIVKNEEKTLPECLRSVAELVNETILVDTGSTDRTVEIARQYGAKVYEFPWCDDFSAARNESLRHATGEWVFWMDADDRIDHKNQEKLKQLFESLTDENCAYTMQVACLPGADGSTTAVDHIRLFRNLPEIRFEFRVHEQVLPSIRRTGATVQWTDIIIQHSGYQDPALRRRKLERDLRLLQQELQDRPDHPFCLFNLGHVAFELEDYQAAVGHLRRSIELSDTRDSQVRKAYALLIQTYRSTGDDEAAYRVCQEARGVYPEDAELLFQEGLLYHERKDYTAAEQAFVSILVHQEGDHFKSIDLGIRGYKTRHNLAMVYQAMGQLDKAENQWREAVAEEPGFVPGWVGLAELVISQGRLSEGETIAYELLQRNGRCVDGDLLLGRIEIARDQFPAAEQRFREAVTKAPDDINAHLYLSELFLKTQRRVEAEGELRSILDLEPNHAGTYHNLGALYLEMGRAHGAIPYLKRAIGLRPEFAMSHHCLGAALQSIGAAEAAERSFQEARRLSPPESR